MKHNKGAFTVHCGINGNKQLYLELPGKLYPSFEACTKSVESMADLADLFSKFAEMDAAMQDTFQMLIFKNKRHLNCIADLLLMMEAMRTVIESQNGGVQ